MQLESITIEKRKSYESTNPNQWSAEVKYRNSSGAVTVLLTPDVSTALLAFVGPLIVQFSAKAAEQIGRECLEEVENLKALNAPPAVDTVQATT